MSKLRFRATLASSPLPASSVTYAVDPSRPSSSAPQKAKRTLFLTLLPSRGSCLAISRIAAVPLPLSLIPGPAGTLSRWAPTTTTLSAAPALDSTSTLNEERGSLSVFVTTCSCRVPAAASVTSWLPSANEGPTTGMVNGRPSVPATGPVRVGSAPSLKITTATAPAAWALAAFTWKVQVPRLTSATLPAVKPAKSAASQPESATVVSTTCAVAVTSPLPE